MTRYFCHECQHEGTDFMETPEPLCSRCRGSFCEELPEDDSIATGDDPRDFDPDDGGLNLGAILQGLGGNAGSGAGGGFGIPQARGGGISFTVGPNGNIVAAGGLGGAGIAGNARAGGGGGNLPQDQLGATIFRALGLAPPLGGNQPRGGSGMQQDAADPDEEDLPRDDNQQDQNRNQVPIQNLADFLGEAFGGPDPHPADDPSNNPFAEGGVDAPRQPERRARSEPGDNAGGAVAQGGNPLSYLFSLMNAFGINGQALGNGIGLAANPSDYIWGGEANFQNLLNDLMEQAAGRAGPVPATEEMIEKLPKLEVTEELLSHDSIKDCTICQDDFALTETLASLPCRHLFHPDCIVPWLKTSGTCPVCRYALIPQPGQEGYVEPTRPNPLNPDPNQTPVNQGSMEASGSTPNLQRPSPIARQSSSAVPSTARIPDVDNGSRLPGGWFFGGADGSGAGDAMDVDEDEGAEEWTDAGNDEGEDKSPERRAAEAAERRIAREREDGASAQGERAPSQPIIEDVD